ncbi:BatA domain-containing protein [Duganella lactea]|uniref:BatA domain-containing protein n=1 Tax=Duganella lactea TaxID=2692173 RepID=UPI00192595FE|nr:BatA domain-containing protein [Duganella lactea]
MILSSYPLWWLALPVLLLPIWWHRQKRQRLKAEPLATARFLPSARPEQLRVWQWRDKLLLLMRCLMLIALIAWLAATIFPWRGDTVLVDAGADRAWVDQQIAAAGFGGATRLPLPQDGLAWLRQHERDWRSDAKLLIVARANQLAMPARLPQFSHPVELRTTAGQSTAVAASESHVALAAQETSRQAWRSLFAAFDSAGNRASRYTLAAEPGAATTLIVWDALNAKPPAGWHAPHWWVSSSSTSAFPELAKASTLIINGITLKYADSPRGRLWTSDAFPPSDADTAHALYDAWQQLSPGPAPAYATPSQTFAAARSALPAIVNARPAMWLGVVLLVLFMLERILTHARRN